MKLIINADDFGISESVNNAIVDAFLNGWITSTTIMVNMPYADQAVQLAIENGFFDKVGLHINLNEGKPLTKSIRSNTLFCNSLGDLKEAFRKKVKTQFYLNKQSTEVSCAEIEAQMKKYIDYGFTLKHFDSHCHLHTYYSIFTIIRPLAEKYGFKSTRLTKNICDKKIRIDKRIYKFFSTIGYEN
jgi:predicted glycoside hydrolase/deacetylase ChbG (UPF0249 family)